MPSFTAIVHIRNDAARLGRTLESLRPCDEILIMDHGSTDDSLRIAREYGAVIRSADRELGSGGEVTSARNEWILCVLPSEIVTEGLEASLYEWKLQSLGEVENIPGYALLVKEETHRGWTKGAPSTRLVPKRWTLWDGELPRHHEGSVLLPGDLLRFRTPE